MGLSFDVHNELGRLMDERLYQGALIADWGAFLDVELYRDAILHFLGGARKLEHPVQIQSDGRIIGHQRMHLVDQSTALHVSPAAHHVRTYEKHLRRLLASTDLTTIHWINFNKRRIVLQTLTNSK